jgi:predicted phage terminase large subunit-like protein
MRLTADYLRTLPSEEVRAALEQLTPQQIQELQYSYDFLARDDQLEPSGDWNVWFINAGRGFGKTWSGVQWVREQVKKGHKRIAAVASTNSDIERVMVKGESGFLSLCWKGDKDKKGKPIGYPLWSPTKRTLTWHKDGDHSQREIARVEFYSAEEPERLRGPQFSAAWCDELASWNKDQDTWDMLQFCLRLGKHPRVCVTTTPKSTVLVRKLLKDPKTVITTGSTFDNKNNLADTYLQAVKDQYEGTRLGRQELYAEVLTENEGALWTADMIDACQVSRDDVPELVRKVVAVDPAVSANVESDSTGIVVAGIDINGKAYVLGDYTFKDSPETWANRVADLYHEFECSRIVYESNQGKDLIPSLFKTVDPNLPLKGVHASNAKIARAEPVSALYEQGKVFHVRNPEDADASLTELETQMTTYEPMGRHKSPDRYDAMVWALTELMLKGVSRPKLKLAYSNAESLNNFAR